MDDILEKKYELKRAELLAKYIKRSKRRRKRVPANTWITVKKLPADFSRQRKVPKIDDDDEIDSAVSSIDMIQRSSTNLTDNATNQCQETTIQVTNPPLILNDFDLAGIDDNLLIDCLLSDIDDMNFILDSEDFDSYKFEQLQAQQQQLQPQQYHKMDLEYIQPHRQFTECRTEKDLDILNEIVTTYNLVPDNQKFDNIQLSHFMVEPPQESILSSSSPFPVSMSSPSIPSTSPQQQLQPEEFKLPDLPSIPLPLTPPSTLSPSSPPSTTFLPPTAPLPVSSQPSTNFSPATTSSPSSPPSESSQFSPTSTTSLPPRPSYGKDIFLLLNDAQNQTDSETCDDESESDE